VNLKEMKQDARIVTHNEELDIGVIHIEFLGFK
jgi:hypothetical protein